MLYGMPGLLCVTGTIFSTDEALIVLVAGCMEFVLANLCGLCVACTPATDVGQRASRLGHLMH